MNRTATFILFSIAVFSTGGCRWFSPARPVPALPPPAEQLAPSPRLIVGRIIAIDAARRFAFVELVSDAPATALAEGNELITRTPDLRETGRLRTSRYLRGRTLGTTTIAGQPAPGDEVVWLAP